MRSPSLLLLVTIACGGGPTGPGKFTGTVASIPLDLKDALFVGSKEVWLSSTEKLCDKLMHNQLPKGGTIAKFTLRPIEAGDFTVDPSTSTTTNHTVFVQFFKLNDTCTNTVAFGPSLGTSGTVTVTDAKDKNGVTGSFDVTFGSTDKTTGNFASTWCDAPTTYPSPECT